MTDLDAVERELREALAPNIQVLRPIGRGAMGAVFLARDPALKRHVVVKVLAPELAHDATARKRFAREAETAAAVSHPNVVDIFHVGELPRSGTGYFIMRHVDGVTLAEACPPGTPLPQARCRRIIGEIASALAAAHARGLVHRDVKPSNIMLDGGAERVVVLDFGISAAAQSASGAMDDRLTMQGTSIGTPAYMSPEQAAGDDVTDRSDVYSLGVLAFELLSGGLPFQAKSPMALAAAHLKDIPPSVMLVRPDVDTAFASLVDRMLAKEPQDRPTADEIARTLLPGTHLIEWPPPGLEKMRGAAPLALKLLTAAAFVLSLRMLFSDPAGDPGDLLAATITALLTVVLITCCSVALGVSAEHARHARRQGYPLAVVFDALLDRTDDTVSLLNGTGVYAALPAGTGMDWLRRRRWAAAAQLTGASATILVAALWAMGVIGLADRVAAQSMTRAGFAAIVAPFLVGNIVAAVLRLPERRFHRRHRPAENIGRQKRRAIPPELVGAWLTSVGEAAPAPLSHRRAVASVSVLEWTLVLLVLLVVGNLVASSVSAVVFTIAGNQASPTQLQFMRLGEATSAAALQPSFDSTLAAHASQPSRTTPDTAAMRALRGVSDRTGMDPGLVWSAFATLPGSFPASVAAALDTGARGSAVQALRQVAAGPLPPAMWLWEGRQISARRKDMDSRSADPLVRLATRNAAAAALALSHGDKTSAVLHARENLAIGRLLEREPLYAAYMRGVGIAASGTRLLQEIAIATGDRVLMREAQSLAAAIEVRRAVEPRFNTITLGRIGSRPDDTTLVALVGNRRLVPVDRWTAAAAIARGVCWNPAELRAGVSPRRADALAEAERRLRDIDRSTEWIQQQREFLQELETSSAKEATGDLTLPFMLSSIRPIARTLLCGMR